jgi:hypothetical protein
MPVLSLKINPQRGVLLPVRVGAVGTPSHRHTEHHALLDTGAEHSSIDQALASEIGLQAVDRTKLVTPTTPEGEERTVYTAALCIEAPGMVSELPSVRLSSAELSAQGFSLILGRDILSRMMLVWDGPAGIVRLAL